jgi:polyhydroxybutyrate depolymerase
MNKKILLFIVLSVLINSALLAGWENKSFKLNGRNRDYRIYIPKDFSLSKKYSLIVGIHGLGDDMTNFSNSFTYLAKVADTANIILAYPQGLENPILGRGWNAGAGMLGIYPSADVNDVAFINAVTDSMQFNFPVDKKRTYLFGFSNGGYMVYRMACQANEKFAAMASIAGTLGNQITNCNPGRPIPILHLHGTADLNVGYYINLFGINVDDLMKKWRNINGCAPTPVREDVPNTKQDGYTVEHYIYQNCKKPLELFKVNNALHIFLYKDINDISYAEEIWRFFSRESLDEDITTGIYNSLKKEDVKILPNPAQDILTIDVRALEIYNEFQLTIFDCVGNEILQLPRNNSGIYTFNCSELPNGIYLINFGNDKQNFTTKFSIVH